MIVIRKAIKAVEKFFLEPASPRPIVALRISLALVLLVQAYLLRGAALDFFSQDGFVQGEISDFLSTSWAPKMSYWVQALSILGFSEAHGIYLVCWLYISSLVLLVIGLFSGPAAVAAWFLHWTLMNSGASTTYGVDLYAHVFLFYLMWMPSADLFSADNLLGRPVRPLSSNARLSLRVLQLHLCITYFFSAVEKAQGPQWWNGELLWRALNLPVYRQFDMSWIAQWPLLSKIGGWSTLFFEMGYCVFIWPKMTRKFWVAAIVGLHLGIAIFLGLELFGVIMCMLTLCIFGVSAEDQSEAQLSVGGVRFSSENRTRAATAPLL